MDNWQCACLLELSFIRNAPACWNYRSSVMNLPAKAMDSLFYCGISPQLPQAATNNNRKEPQL